MVARCVQHGLIVSLGAQTTAPLEELATRCGWPVLLNASANRLRRELDLQSFRGVLFWLEDRQHVAATANLMTWLRQRHPRPYRIAIAYRFSGDVEPLFRAAGVHSYMLASGDIAAVAEEVLRPLLECAGLGANTLVTPSVGPKSFRGAAANLGARVEPAHPP
jgi:hypothetical protein